MTGPPADVQRLTRPLRLSRGCFAGGAITGTAASVSAFGAGWFGAALIMAVIAVLAFTVAALQTVTLRRVRAAAGAPMRGPGGRWRPVSDLPAHDARAAGHFAVLAAEGRQSCADTGCPLCAARDAGPEIVESMRRWFEDERRDGQ